LTQTGGELTAYAIETLDLSKTYKSGKKRLDALKNLSLQVEDGYVFGFIGPNGAGKTTTIKSLMGLIRPSSGEARIFGEPIGTVASKNKIGYLSEIAYYYNFMEAENLLHFYGALRAIPREERSRRINENLELVGLADRKKTRLKEYSKGMLQRFGIALALIGDPPLLLLDEPTSGLDPIGQKEMKDIIIRLKSRGKSIFFSSHQLTEVERICDRIGIIHQGRMLECGPLDHFLQQDTGIYSLRVSISEDASKELESRSVSVRKDSNDEKIMRITCQERDLPELIGLLQRKEGKLLEIIAGPGDLEELFVEIIRKGEQKA
jgi:ABC-2 type transport system ATP-binding protein